MEKKPTRQKVIAPKTTTTVIIKKETPKVKEAQQPPKQLTKKNEIQNQSAPKQEKESQQVKLFIYSLQISSPSQ